ncbi:MAG: CpsD/CapB family tyrosine-protein kinase [bacterium]|nr:CpsD/CapB family tyrosine-protein kinase [bacterium]
MMKRKAQGPAVPLAVAFEDLVPATSAVWANVVPHEREEGTTRILFTAPEAGAGTTALAAATALGLARHLRSTVGIVEANFASPGLARFLGVEEQPGLGDHLVGVAKLPQCRREVPAYPGLLALPAGSARPPVPGELANDAGRAMLDVITSGPRFVVIDAPPILEATETRTLLDYADVAVIVMRARHTQRKDAERATRMIQESGVHLLGTVLNAFRPDVPFAA